MTYTPDETLKNIYNHEHWVVESQDGAMVTLVRRITIPTKMAVMTFARVSPPDQNDYCLTCGIVKKGCQCYAKTV